MNDVLAELLTIFALILANGVFSGAEIALVAVRSTRLQDLVEHGSKSARAAQRLKGQPEQLLATIQVGITVIGATAAAVGGASVAQRLTPLIERVHWLRPYASQIALGIVIFAISYLSIVLGELVPKSISLRQTERIALLVARPLLGLSRLARPLVAMLTATSNLILKPFGDRTTFTESRYSAEEIAQLVEEAKRSGSLHPHAAEIASRALEFPELEASDVMVARRDVAMLPRDASLDEIKRMLIERSHTRLPVFGTDHDDVLGYVHIKDLATLSWQHEELSLQRAMRPPYFVPSSKPAVDLLAEMQREHVPLAMVVDEQGGFAGIITLEDLLEELVGEIFSEHAPKTLQPIVRQADGSWVVAGTEPIREINRATGLALPEDGDFNTLAGLFIHLAGFIPRAGERRRLPDGAEIEVLDASQRRVRSLRVYPPPEPPLPPPD